MVKINPKNRVRLTRRKRKVYDYKQHTLTLPNTTTTTTLSSDQHLRLQQQQPNTSFFKTQQQQQQQVIDQSVLVTPETPPTKKRKSRSPAAAASFSSSTYATCYSSSSETHSPSFSSPSPSFFLRRTLSDSPMFLSHSTSKKLNLSNKEFNASSSSSAPVVRNLMSQLPPLPPQPSPNLLKRSFSDPVPLFLPPNNYSLVSKKEDEKEKKEEQAVKVEKLSMELTLIKFKCGCGSYTRLLFSSSDAKCYKLP